LEGVTKLSNLRARCFNGPTYWLTVGYGDVHVDCKPAMVLKSFEFLLVDFDSLVCILTNPNLDLSRLANQDLPKIRIDKTILKFPAQSYHS